MRIALTIVQLDITDLTILIEHGQHHRIDKALIGSEIQFLVAFQHLLMKRGVDFHSIGLHQPTGSLIIALALDTLHLCQQSGYQPAQLLIVGNLHIRLSFALHQLDGITVLVAPMGNEGTITHVGLFYLMTRCDTYQLGHQTVHHIGVILRFIRFLIRRQTQFHQFVIRHVIESKQIGTGFLNGVAISLQAVGIHTRQQLSATVSQTFVQVGMQVVAHVTIFLYQLERSFVNHKLLLKTTSLCRLVISIGNVADGNTLRAITGTYPVSIGQIDTDGR